MGEISGANDMDRIHEADQINSEAESMGTYPGQQTPTRVPSFDDPPAVCTKKDRLCDQGIPRLTAEVGLPNLSMICQALSQAHQATVMVLRAHQVWARQALALPMGMGMGLERTPASDVWAAQVAHPSLRG